MRLQETPDEIPEGGTPHTVSLLMHDKLVDAGKPGDRIEVKNLMTYQRMLCDILKNGIVFVYCSYSTYQRVQEHI